PGAAGPGAATGNLRVSLSSFVGRDAERGQLSDAVRSNRLITLIGPGGVGKTRLAIEAAAALDGDLGEGSWLVELAAVVHPGDVAPATARALGAVGAAGPRSPGPAGALIVDHLAGRSLVVILDNCEHVIGAAATLAEELVGAVPGLHLIATSREPLGVPGEVLFPVGGLSVAAATELFADRARAVQPGFVHDGPTGEVVSEICRRLDGLPLAVELAAARLRALPLATVAQRIDDRFRLLTGGARTARPRQQTLRAVVDWSYDLLFDDERRLFARLAVFSGGCELAAAEAVCADGEMHPEEVLDVLGRLVDKSLITPPGVGQDARFTQLQTLWEYGRERLEHSAEADVVHARHAAYFLHLAEQAHTGLRGATGPEWRQRVTVEICNLRSALDWFISAGDADASVSLASGLAWHWFLNSDFAEGARWLGDALQATGPCRTDVGATGHAWHGYFVAMSSNPEAAVVECAEALAVLATGGDLRRLEALVCSAAVLVRAHAFARSLELLSQAHELLEVPGRGWFLAAHDLLMAWNLVSLGRLDEASAAARSSAARFDAEGEVFLVTSSLHGLAGIAEAQGDLDGATRAYELLLERCRVTGQRQYSSFALVALATLRSRQGDDASADRLYQEAIAHTFNPWPSADALVGRAAIARRMGDLAGAREFLDAAQDRYREVDLPAGSAGVLVGRAWWAIAANRADDAAVFAAEAVRIAAASGEPGTQALAETAAGAVSVVCDPSPSNVAAFRAMADGREQRRAFPPLVTDDPDVAELMSRLALLPSG
ncbi:MAG: ATP-binding protein, partial [Acidimicrobiales bacterium]